MNLSNKIDECDDRNEAAKICRDALLHYKNVNWSDLNWAIVKKWSTAGLKYVKLQAWK